MFVLWTCYFSSFFEWNLNTSKHNSICGRVESMNILGVTLFFSAIWSVNPRTCWQTGMLSRRRLCMLCDYLNQRAWLSRIHGRCTRDILVSSITYASQAGCDMRYKQLVAVLTKAIRQGFLPADVPTFSKICEGLIQSLFRSILQNPDHVLHQPLPSVLLNPRITACANDHMIG